MFPEDKYDNISSGKDTTFKVSFDNLTHVDLCPVPHLCEIRRMFFLWNTDLIHPHRSLYSMGTHSYAFPDKIVGDRGLNLNCVTLFKGLVAK